LPNLFSLGLTWMIHYTCDRCKAVLNPADQSRYVVQVEVHCVGDPAVQSTESAEEGDVDSLSELHQLLEGMEDEAMLPDQDLPTHRGRYDLCPPCYKQFLRNPLGRDTTFALHFSNN
jgi:hypothetical protein